MNDVNQQTIQSYNEHVEEYIKGTPQQVSGEVQAWLDENLKALAPNAKILELGSAFGRDADYIESRGFKVERTDASKAFVDYLRNQGRQARVLNALTDELGAGYDMIFANGVLLHFNRSDAEAAIDKICHALLSNGRFLFSLKRGDGEEVSSDKLGAPRYFCYWQLDEIKTVLERNGFLLVHSDTADDPRPNVKWLFLTAIRKAA